MLEYLPSFPYPPEREGFWDPPTATIKWCEEKYYATVYSAEIVNTTSNLMFLILAYKGISNCIRHSHPQVFFVGFLSYLSIGIGSILFHSSLQYPMQLLDELSMVYTSCVMLYPVFSHRQSPRARLAIFLVILSLAGFITGYYYYLQDPLFHQNMFTLLTLVVVLRSMWIMELLRPSRRIAKGEFGTANSTEQARNDRRDEQILKKMWMLVACGLGSVAVGFSIWNLDHVFCGVLRQWRRDVGLPWGIFLEGHGWWHIMTGIAAYFNLTWAIWLQYCREGKQDEVELLWPSIFTSFPVVVKTRKTRSEKSE